MNKTGDNFFKSKTQSKKATNTNNNVDKQRKKSVDLVLDKRNKKPERLKTEKNVKNLLKNENNKNKRRK